MLLVPLGIALLAYTHRGVSQPWPSVTAQVLETRIIAVAAEEHPFGPGTILYRAQAHVSYQMDGKRIDRWLPASNTSRDRAYLQLWLSQRKSKTCMVHWNPRNPADMEAVLN